MSEPVRPYAMEHIPGLPLHCLINGFFFCGSQRVAEVPSGEEYGENLRQHLKTEHGVDEGLFPAQGSWAKNAFLAGTRNGKPVLSTQLHKSGGWSDHYDPGTGAFLGCSFKCPCGFASKRARPGETYPPIQHECNYHQHHGWRIWSHELDDERWVMLPEWRTGPDKSGKVTKVAIGLPAKAECRIETTDSHLELRLPAAKCWQVVEVGDVTTDRRVLKGLTVKAPRELRVPQSLEEPDLFRPTLDGGFVFSAADLVWAALPDRCGDISFSADETVYVLASP